MARHDMARVPSDVASYHDRQVVVLEPNDWRAWLDLTRPEAELLRPLPTRSLKAHALGGRRHTFRLRCPRRSTVTESPPITRKYRRFVGTFVVGI